MCIHAVAVILVRSSRGALVSSVAHKGESEVGGSWDGKSEEARGGRLLEQEIEAGCSTEPLQFQAHAE